MREIFQQRDTQGALLRIWEKGDLYRGGLRALQHSSTDLDFPPSCGILQPHLNKETATEEVTLEDCLVLVGE